MRSTTCSASTDCIDCAVGHRRDAQLVLAEIIGDQLPDGGVVVHRKHMRLGRLGGCLELRVMIAWLVTTGAV